MDITEKARDFIRTSKISEIILDTCRTKFISKHKYEPVVYTSIEDLSEKRDGNLILSYKNMGIDDLDIKIYCSRDFLQYFRFEVKDDILTVDVKNNFQGGLYIKNLNPIHRS